MTPTDSQAARLLREVLEECEGVGCEPCIGSYSPFEDLCGRIKAHLDNTRPREDARVVDEWRPIETAPQGVMILLADMTATEARHWAFVGWKHHWNKDGHVETPSAINRRATHWKRLPQPPALAAALGESNG